MKTFAESVLSHRLARPLTDRTGIAGVFDFEIVWVPEEHSAPEGAQVTPGAEPSGTYSPLLLAAMAEQVGLEVKSIKEALPAVIVDHAEKASVN